jgi:hypothetical protein
MMNYVENAMPKILGCPDKVAGFYDILDVADDERLHAIGVSTKCTQRYCTRLSCPFRPEPGAGALVRVVTPLKLNGSSA